MKKNKFYIAWMAMLFFIFTSCSKDETNGATQDDELIQLTFGSILNDFKEQNKQAIPGEVCRDEVPAYVMLGITDATGTYIDDGDADADDLFRVDLKWNTGLEVWETVYTEQLGLPAGNYQLEHFVVYDSNGDVLWVAPRIEGSYGDYVGNELPQDIVLAAGTKPYINVDVLCFISRNEDAYGYVFFDIDTNPVPFNPVPVENDFCVFVNFCDDTTGRDYPAYCGVKVWTDGFGGQNEVVLDNNINQVTMSDDGWPSASVLCFALQDIGEDAVYYVRVTAMNHADLDYTVNVNNYHDFMVTQADMDTQKNQFPPYEMIRINCEETTE